MADDNIQTAPVSPDNASATVNNAPNASDSGNADQNSTNNPAPQESEFDPRTSYDSLVKELQSVNKNYGNLRSEFTRRTQYEAQLKQQIETLHKAFAEATKQEVSPEEFMKSLQTQGVKAFDPLREQWTKELSENHNKALEERDTQILSLKTNFEVMRRELDSKSYPDFATLKPLMNEIANSENCPVDWNQDVGIIYDTLYKLARDLKAEESVKEAHERGLKKGEALAAKEASTAVATGGKASSITNPGEIKDLKKLREYFVSQLGEAE